MRISGWIYIILVVGFIATATFTTITTLGAEENYNVDVDAGALQNFDRTIVAAEQIDNSYQKMINSSVDKTSFLALVPEAVSIVKNMIVLPFNALGDIATSVMDVLGLPGPLQIFVMGVILASMLLSVIALILRYRYT